MMNTPATTPKKNKELDQQTQIRYEDATSRTEHEIFSQPFSTYTYTYFSVINHPNFAHSVTQLTIFELFFNSVLGLSSSFNI